MHLETLRDDYDQPEAGTGTWIFKDDRYMLWREGKGSRFLWLCGGPGTGKTMLAKRVASEFLSRPDSSKKIVKLVFYFVSPRVSAASGSAEADPPEPMLAKVASDLLYCILQQDGSLFRYCKDELKNQGPKFFTNHTSLWKVLKDVIEQCHQDSVYILIDGIDRFGKELCKRLIRKILGLINIQKVKIFFCSREAPYISNTLPHDPDQCITINLDTCSLVKGDVETFIRQRMNSLGWDTHLREKAKEALLARSEGFFLWASLVVNNLINECRGPGYEMLLAGLPPELEDEYEKMLHIPPSQRDSSAVLNIIWSVALALRPPTFAELGHILACIEETATAQQPTAHPGAGSKIQPRPEGELRGYILPSLGFLRATNTTVSMVHRTARDYLFDQCRKGSLRVLSKSDADLAVSWKSFQYLHDALRGPDQALSNWEFLGYAAECWLIHAHQSIDASDDNPYDDPVRNWLRYQFFETSDIIRNRWIRLCGDSRMQALAGEQTKLHIAVGLGLMPLVEKVLSGPAERTQSNQSLLHPDQDPNRSLRNTTISRHWATFVGLVEIFPKPTHRVRGRRVNKKNCLGNTPLHLAFQFDHPSIVQLLIEKGADPAIKNDDQQTVSELGALLKRTECLNILERQGVPRRPRREPWMRLWSGSRTGHGRNPQMSSRGVS